VGVEPEAAVRAFLAELEGHLDADRTERVVNRMAADARYHVLAWHEPFVGHDAIRAELLRQGTVWIEIPTIASAGNVVFTERVDSMILRGKPIASRIVGVFEVDDEGKVSAWRDYLDSREVSTQLGRAPTGSASSNAIF
jgi:limonene-1,2-epoxide hydrolase